MILLIIPTFCYDDFHQSYFDFDFDFDFYFDFDFFNIYIYMQTFSNNKNDVMNVLKFFYTNILLNDKALKIIGAYGIAHVLAQDLGTETQSVHNHIVNYLPVQLCLLYSGAYIITNDRDPNIDLSPFLTIGFPEREKLNDQNMICILLQYSFINKDDNIVMEVIDPPLTTKSLTNMPGEFNISKWARSTNFCFFTDPNINKISFKRGEPLYAVRFQTTDNTVLSEITDHDRRFKVLAAQGSAANVKEWLPRLTLNECYKMFENKMKSFWN